MPRWRAAGFGLGRTEPVWGVGAGRQPKGIGNQGLGGGPEAEAADVVFVGGEQRGEDVEHQAFPRGTSALIGALSDAAEERQEGVGDTAQDGHDESAARVARDPRMVIFCEGAIQYLMRGFHSPMPTNEEQPMLGVTQRQTLQVASRARARLRRTAMIASF